MSHERPTIRPVNLARLAEAAYLASSGGVSTDEIESELDVTRRRVRETCLEAQRVELIGETHPDENGSCYETTDAGVEFIDAIRTENWDVVSGILESGSPHYRSFLTLLNEKGPLSPANSLTKLEQRSQSSPQEYNETSIDIVANWAQRLGVIHRNAFTGSFYTVSKDVELATFPSVLVATANDMEETAGVNLRQRYLSIPRVREEVCERLGCSRSVFDDALVSLAHENVGRIELSGAPIDTGAKSAQYGIKTIRYADGEAFVSTEQTTEQIMQGVELRGKKYYYLTIHDEKLQSNP